MRKSSSPASSSSSYTRSKRLKKKKKKDDSRHRRKRRRSDSHESGQDRKGANPALVSVSHMLIMAKYRSYNDECNNRSQELWCKYNNITLFQVSQASCSNQEAVNFSQSEYEVWHIV